MKVLRHNSIKELGLEQPNEDTISYDDYFSVKALTTRVKIVTGWYTPFE